MWLDNNVYNYHHSYFSQHWIQDYLLPRFGQFHNKTVLMRFIVKQTIAPVHIISSNIYSESVN